MRAAIERAWFEQRAVVITYVDGNSVETTRQVRIEAVVMDRHETRLEAVDLETGDRRPFRLDRITRAKIPETAPPGSEPGARHGP